jgi:AcrR family transcriptional regulator
MAPRPHFDMDQTKRTGIPGPSSDWINPAAQKRSTRTLRRILRSATEHLNQRAFDEITVAEICRDAGCSPPSFYQRFKDKEALLHALHERYTTDTIAAVRQFLDPDGWHGRSIEELVRTLAQGMVALETQAGGLRITAVRRSLSNDHFAARIRRIRDELYRHLADVLRRLHDQVPHRDPEHAARFLVRLIQGVAVRHLEGRHLETDTIDHDELVEDLSRVCLAYLGVTPERAR